MTRRTWTLLSTAALAGLALAQGGARPGAGSTLMTPVPQFSTLGSTGMADDPARGVIWVGATRPSFTIPGVFLWPANRTTLGQAVAPPPVVTDELDGGGPAGADLDGPVSEVAVLSDGTLLLTDHNGDRQRFDDTLFHLDPTAGALLGFWYTDDQTCIGAACRANTNTDVPRNRIDELQGIDASDGNVTGPGPIFVGSHQAGGQGIVQVALVPGRPGSWTRVAAFASPTGGPVNSIDFDPDQALAHGLPNVYWMTGGATTATSTQPSGLVYETTFTGTAFVVNQVFLAPPVPGDPLTRIGGSVTALRGTSAPHALALWHEIASTTLPAAVRVDAGSGAVPGPMAMEGDLFHSLLDNALSSTWDASFLDEELGLWSAGRLNARTHTAREELQVLLGTIPASFDIDGISIDPSFAGTDPSILDFHLSVDVNASFGATPVARQEVFRVRADGSVAKLFTAAQLGQAVGADLTVHDLDAFEVLPGGSLLASFDSNIAGSANPNLGSPIDRGDVLLIPAGGGPNSAVYAWKRGELAALAASLGHTLEGDIDAVALDSLGSPSRPNPHPGGSTRPDILFNDGLNAWTSHIFSTRGGSGAVARDRRSFGYGVRILGVDALTAVPGATVSPTMDATSRLTGTAPNRINELRLFGRNLGAGATGFWALGPRLSPAVDLRPTLTHNPLMVLPSALIPFLADGEGNAELRVDVPELGAPATFHLQAVSLARSALTPGTILTVR